MIRWSKELEVGDEIIDTQHKILIHTLEEVYEACSRGEGVKQLEQTINYLIDYVNIHFEAEEALQRKYNYPYYEKHKKIHERYKWAIRKIAEQRSEEGYTTKDLAELISYLNKMIVSHIQQEDINITRYIKGETEKIEYNSVGRCEIDKLTGLFAEGALYSRIEKYIEQDREKQFVYIGVNIQEFNRVNYSYGFDIGDEVLMYIAGYLQMYCSENLAMGRVYGDRFGIFMEKTKVLSEIIENAAYVKQKIEAGFRRKGSIIPLTLSVGVTVYPDNGTDLKMLRQAVNIAINESKLKEGNPVIVFEEKFKERIMRKANIIKLIQHHNLAKYLRVVYQPICVAKTGNIKGCEALLRLVDEEGVAISPVEFIPLAEKNNLINDLTYFCIREVGRLLEEIPREKLSYISVNLSPQQFEDPKFIKYMEALIGSGSLDMSRMFFEITETAIVDNFDKVTQCLKKLREMGSEIMIDDFGQAYSSLSYLGRMEVDAIKIDKSFLDDICCNENAKIILRGIVELAHQIGLRVIVEGVETDAQWRILKELQVERVQGFLFSKPLEKNELMEKLL